METDVIYNADCIKKMKELPNDSIDLILTDPPYKLDWKESINFNDRKNMFHHKENTEKWDNIDIKKLYEILFKEFDRLVKYSGSVLIFTRNEYITYAVESAKDNNFDNKATIIWHKTNPMTQVRKVNYLSSIESILWVARYDEEKCPFTFNFTSQKEMHNYIEGSICMGNERTEHPTQKPLYLLNELIQVHSNEEDIILDPFLGSGSTAVSALKNNRRFIGIEKNQKWYEKSLERVGQLDKKYYQELPEEKRPNQRQMF